ncbi:MAG: hypothetical protein P1U53_05780 [Sulfitobacter sp.]|nr:hypothetical protein [Sulfitobacter sp.]
MRSPFLRTALVLPFLALAACDEIAVADDPAALAQLRGTKSCVAAVKRQTGASAVTPNTTLPVVEVNQYVIDVAAAPSWTCYTDDNNNAAQLVEMTS